MSLREHVSMREHACVSSRGAQSTELVSLYIGYWTLNNYYYYYRALHASLQCICPHPVRKQISVRAIRRIKDDAIVKDLDKFSIDQRGVDVDTMVEMYDRFLSELLDKHAPLKKTTVVDRPLNEWMTDNILALKAIRRKNELIWRKTRITINFNIYYDSCMDVKKAISIRKAELMEQNVINCEGDQKKTVFSHTFSIYLI